MAGKKEKVPRRPAAEEKVPARSGSTSSAYRHGLLAGLVALSAIALGIWQLQLGGRTDPQVFSYRVKATYPHDPNAFTQGLLMLNGSLYESTGLYGRSEVRRVTLQTGEVSQSHKLSDKDFGEGLVALQRSWGVELLQLLWRTGRGWRYNLTGDGAIVTPGQRIRMPLKSGWGLEQLDTGELVATDGGKHLYILENNSFKMLNSLTVTDDDREVLMVNELEMINGSLWANIYAKECLARIDPTTGAVTAWALLHGLKDPKQGDVLNGIAWEPESRRLFITGKLWPALFEAASPAKDSPSTS